MKRGDHLPLMGVGPVIVVPQLLLTAFGIILSMRGWLDFGKIKTLRGLFLILGVALIAFGFYLWFSANFQTKVDQYIKENRLVTAGVYGIVRNPIYSAFLLVCTGGVLLASNLLLFLVPSACWLYMTILLKKTEERWLLDLYGQEYVGYCSRVNRCIPWFLKK